MALREEQTVNVKVTTVATQFAILYGVCLDRATYIAKIFESRREALGL